MATRAIVTSHPVVACDVCGRSLLRGETPDVFLAGGQRRTVCELCVPRAAAGGWLREADNHAASAAPTRSRRRRGSFLGRLRQLRQPAQAPSQAEQPDTGLSASDGDTQREELYDFLDNGSIGPAESYEADLYMGLESVDGTSSAQLPDDTSELTPQLRATGPAQKISTSERAKVARALEVFNEGEQPRRVAGVARSLGVPSVSVRPLGESTDKVAIVVAWELCWYRYEVDLSDQSAETRLVTQGMELDELAAEDRLANASADERGELSRI